MILDLTLHRDGRREPVRFTVRRVGARHRHLAGTAIHSGTLAALGGELIGGERFEATLADERRGRTLRCDYRVTPIAWVNA